MREITAAFSHLGEEGLGGLLLSVTHVSRQEKGVWAGPLLLKCFFRAEGVGVCPRLLNVSVLEARADCGEGQLEL